MKKETVSILSQRGTLIPADIVSVEGKGGLLILAHGFKAERTEDGRFTFVAEQMAEHGFHSIRMDFPACGDSKEPFIAYSLDHCLEDMESCFLHMKERYEIDDRLYLLGYSMGGRLISLFLRKHPEIKKLVFWAACNRSFDLDDLFLGQSFRTLKEQCDREGSCDFYDIYTQETDRMSAEFVSNMLEEDALGPLESFKGDALILQGDHDQTIEVGNAQWIYDHLKQASGRNLHYIHGADHGFGLWDGRTQDSEELIKTTVSFLKG
ncbi:MAG: alpha/beta fold hydrolase [Erysipelotrichaceae bacterium]|nr:alpha/beta fold hydrolase [Erysipelotrichaceae bacterium]